VAPAPAVDLHLFDHVGWRDTDQMYRVVTFGWGQMLARLKGFLDTGKPMPVLRLLSPASAGLADIGSVNNSPVHWCPAIPDSYADT
jgi:hypothetical protein